MPDLAELLAKGYAVAAVNYRLTRDPMAAAQDAKAAVRFLRANAQRFRLDPDRFAAWGDSAGRLLGADPGRHGGPAHRLRRPAPGPRGRIRRGAGRGR